ncbi:MAG: DUF11 domain-containing protein, partial [bacterium]|nr:DUF11 domain-containing protein [bacterium]
MRWLEPVLDLAVSKRASAAAVRPGGEVEYDLFVVNEGTREPQDVVLTDLLPEHLELVSASDGGVYDPSTRTVTWSFPEVGYEETIAIGVTVSAASVLPFDTPAINVATVTDSGLFGPDQDPDDNTATASVRLWDDSTPIVEARPPVNLSRTAGVFADASSAISVATSVSMIIDGDLDTSWFTACGDAANQGGSPFAEVVLPRAASVQELRVFGNRHATGQDVTRGFFQLFDADGGMLLETPEVDLPAPDRDLALAIPATAGVRRVRFTSTGDESCSPGLAELELIGFYGDAEGDEVTEGGTLDLLARFFDTDPTEMHTATVDWGDGEVESIPVLEAGGNGTAEGSHVYLDDGQYTVEVCVTDTAGNTGCDTLALTVVNAAPVINQRDIDLRTWQVEAWADDVHPNTPNWVIEDDGKSAVQTVNAPSSVLLSDFPAFDTRITGSIEV